jgi:threonyl-tRNA synthetase
VFKIILKDGALKEFPNALTGFEIAQNISNSLAKKVVAIKVNDEMWDLNRLVPNNSKIELITKDTEEGLEVIRHDMAHIMAEAVKELYPETQITIGPAIENGFYYDFYRDIAFTFEDLENIEQKMKEIVDRDELIVREEWQRNDAVKFFKNEKEHFKAEIIESIPEDQTITLYRQGNFIDLCKGPHLTSTKQIGKAFKLTKLAGAYWRGDSKNPMLQRIYGTGWANEKDLEKYLKQIEEAEKRDHRKLGQELDLFHIQDEAVGSIFWHPNGWVLYRNLENFIRNRLEKNGYVEVRTPQILDKSLWEASGHWEKFGDDMFVVKSEDKTMAIKPMNCPCHIQIFKQGLKSYKDLPIRMAEFGCCHRNESSGSLHGLMRVRSFVQDDAHIFCMPEQIVEETKSFCELLKSVYKDLGFEEIKVRFSDRPVKRAGSDEVWDRAEKALLEATQSAGLDYVLNKGEGAFYGPKLEFVLKDAMGRSWQCGTLQADFVLPERLDASYIGEDGKKHRPVMLHRAILGTFERFLGIFIEHHGGKFPIWLAPVQAVILNITQDSADYAKQLHQIMVDHGIRAKIDLRNEKINYKIREHSLKKVPYLVVVGKNEISDRTVSIREFGSNDQKVSSFDNFLQELIQKSKMP